MTGDSSNAFLKAVKGTDVKFALSAFPPEQSEQCLDVALDILAGRPVPNIVNVDSAAYTQAQLDKYIRPECSERDPERDHGGIDACLDCRAAWLRQRSEGRA